MSSGDCPPSRSLVILPSMIRKLDKIPLFTTLFTVEIIATLTGMALCLLAYQCRMQLKVHTNLRRIVGNVSLTFIFLAPSRFVLMAMTMNWESDGKSVTVRWKIQRRQGYQGSESFRATLHNVGEQRFDIKLCRRPRYQ